MIEPCEKCASERVAAVIDKRIEKSPTPGNKYRRRCLSCEKWLTMCSAADFQTAETQHVLPADVDPESDQPTVPAEEFEGDVDGLATASSGDAPEIRADGGQVEDDDEDENSFECPACGSPVTGFPDNCPWQGCGVPYRWDESESED